MSPCLLKGLGDPWTLQFACLSSRGLTSRPHAQGLIRGVPADTPRFPGSRAVMGPTGALVGGAGRLGGPAGHGFPLDLRPGTVEVQAATGPAVEGQGQEKSWAGFSMPWEGDQETRQ